jgi:hypothetical protein
MYRVETWTWTKANTGRLMAAHMRLLEKFRRKNQTRSFGVKNKTKRIL